MVFVCLLVVLAGYFCFVGHVSQAYPPARRTAKLTKPLSKLINIAPLIGLVVFLVLFLFVLKGQLLERISHAVLVFGLWLYAVHFYQYALSYLHKKKIVVASAAGMVFSVVLAVMLTPLDRYVQWFYSFLKLGSLFLRVDFCSCFMWSNLFFTEHREQIEQEGALWILRCRTPNGVRESR